MDFRGDVGSYRNVIINCIQMIFKTLRKDKILWEAVGTRRIIPWDTSKIRGWETKKLDLESVAPEIEVKPEASCFSRSQVKMNIKGEGTITESNAANR